LRAPDDRPRRRSWRGLLAPAILAFLVLIGLGTWQIHRKAWKEALIGSLTRQLAAAPKPLPSSKDWATLSPDREDYHRVAFDAAFDYAHEALVYGAASAFRPDASGPGYWVFTPARLADGGLIMVNRGFVPEGRQDPKTRAAGNVPGVVHIIGAIRAPDARHWYTPGDEPNHNLWFTRDPQAMADAKGLGPVAPFYIEQEAPVPPGGLPQPGKIVVNLPDNHLQYALTWYGLALVLAIMFGSWAFGLSHKEDAGRNAPSPSL